MNNNDLERYGRHILLPQIDYEGQQKLIESHVMVIGLGGLGSPASIYLASSGIGRLTICDFDKVELSNLQRQILFNEKNIDTNKAQSAKINLSRINSSIKIDSIDFKLTEEKLSDYLKTNNLKIFDVFKQLDEDSSMTLTAYEFREGLNKLGLANLPPHEVDRLVSALDMNGDGMIDLPELGLAFTRDMMPAKIIESNKEEKEEKEEEINLSKLKKAELVEIAKERSINSSGTKKEILERLNSEE